jgi:SUKH-4 immunity protein of toxin-antitoxin system
MSTDIPEIFRRCSLLRWPPELVQQMGLSESDAAYLRDIGLPVGVDWTLEVQLPPGGVPLMHEGLPVLFRDGGVPICVNPSAGGEVLAIEPHSSRRMNANVRCLGAFLMLYQDYRARVRDCDDDQVVALIDNTEQRMRESDPDAMSEPEGYWPTIVEQMRNGML